LQVGQRHQAIWMAYQHALQVMQALIRLMFMYFQMAGGMKRDAGNVAAVRPDAQGDLLAHGAAGHEDGCLFAQYLRYFLFKLGDDFPFAIEVRLFVEANDLGQVSKYLIWALGIVPAEEARTGALYLFLFAAMYWIAPFFRKAAMLYRTSKRFA
jgi:hypothetical protein